MEWVVWALLGADNGFVAMLPAHTFPGGRSSIISPGALWDIERLAGLFDVVDF